MKKKIIKHIDKLIYIVVILFCGYFSYQTRYVNVHIQENTIKQFEAQFDVEREKKPFSLQDANQTVIGVLYVPSIHLKTSIFDNAEEYAISNGAGLIRGTGTLQNEIDNSVITAHNGDPSKDLFINIPKLKKNDEFFLKLTDGKIYKYRVFDIREVSPVGELEQLIEPTDKSIVTLRTCTPIGINNKRFLAAGEFVSQVETEPSTSGITISLFEYGLIFISLISIILLIKSFMKN